MLMTCKKCNGKGHTSLGGIRKKCLECDGLGYITKNEDKGEDECVKKQTQKKKDTTKVGKNQKLEKEKS